MANPDVRSKTNTRIDVTEPPMFKVIYLNDNVTSLEFVIASLVNYFNYETTTAVNIAESIHESGNATVAVLPYEVAEQKGIEITLEARSQGFPLQIKLDPDVG
jgi:ATP-dependent Clp protease adaptor protein ClpS